MQQDVIDKIADRFLWAVNAKAGNNIIVQYETTSGKPLAEACERKALEMGLTPIVRYRDVDFYNERIANASDEDLERYAKEEMAVAKGAQHRIRISDVDPLEGLTVSQEAFQKYDSVVAAPVVDYIVHNTDWLLTTALSPKFAEACGMDMEACEVFYQNGLLANYEKIEKAIPPLKDIMGEKNSFHIKGKDTDLTFETVGGGQSKACFGKRNLPDGEVFTAPTIDSLNGHILFSANEYNGQKFEWIYLEFEDGLVVKAVAENEERTEALNKILDKGGARRVGEFAMGFNPNITQAIGDGLWDEKIAGSIHFALGRCIANYADNGNRSDVHWDLIHIQTPEYGGGEIWMNGELIRKDGEFIVPKLEGLNPANLLG